MLIVKVRNAITENTNTKLTISLPNAHFSIDTLTGVLGVSAFTPSGDYNIPYTIEDPLDPTNYTTAAIERHQETDWVNYPTHQHEHAHGLQTFLNTFWSGLHGLGDLGEQRVHDV